MRTLIGYNRLRIVEVGGREICFVIFRHQLFGSDEVTVVVPMFLGKYVLLLQAAHTPIFQGRKMHSVMQSV